jgi:hypothetical protein
MEVGQVELLDQRRGKCAGAEASAHGSLILLIKKSAGESAVPFPLCVQPFDFIQHLSLGDQP